jgi:hypothetical protein
MSLGRLLRSSFSRYEIAIMGMILTYALAIVALVAIGTQRIGAGLILFLVGIVTALAFREFSRCPECRKPPFVRARGEVGFLLAMMARNRLWPERRCSGCGTALDVGQDD